MNNLTASVSLSSSQPCLDLGRSIRDSIFYYEDLMGVNATSYNEAQKVNNPINQADVLMAEIFDEAMFECQVRIESKEREQKIKQLLKSIEAFHLDGFDEE